MARFPRTEAEVIALAQSMVSGLTDKSGQIKDKSRNPPSKQIINHQSSIIIFITTPANENQADFGQKDTKINTIRLPCEALAKHGHSIFCLPRTK